MVYKVSLQQKCDDLWFIFSPFILDHQSNFGRIPNSALLFARTQFLRGWGLKLLSVIKKSEEQGIWIKVKMDNWIEKLPSVVSVLEKSPRRERGRRGAPFPSAQHLAGVFFQYHTPT